MAKNTSRSTKTAKTESLTIRLDPKTRFMLEYLSRLNGQTITTVVERAILKSANESTVKSIMFGGGETEQNWQDFWDVEEGARALNVAGEQSFFPTYDEEKRLEFCREHWPFFYINSQKAIFSKERLSILWPNIDDYIDIHEKRKEGGDYWAAGKRMQEALRHADLNPPKWPQNSAGPMDDEIPF